MMGNLDAIAVLGLVERLAAVAIIIACIEALSAPRLVADTALSGWRVSRLARGWTAGGIGERALGAVVGYPNVLGVFAARLACAALLVIVPDSLATARLVLLGAAALGGMLLSIRSPFGQDGADQMSNILILAAFAGRLGGDAGIEAALWFVTLQACLAYFAAGAAKLISPTWRSGRAITGVFSTDSYGQAFAASFVSRHPLLPLAAAWLVIVWECVFPLVLLGEPAITWPMLVLGVFFHIGTIVCMRLSTFLWAFTATYPAILYCTTAHPLLSLLA